MMTCHQTPAQLIVSEMAHTTYVHIHSGQNIRKHKTKSTDSLQIETKIADNINVTSWIGLDDGCHHQLIPTVYYQTFK